MKRNIILLSALLLAGCNRDVSFTASSVRAGLIEQDGGMVPVLTVATEGRVYSCCLNDIREPKAIHADLLASLSAMSSVTGRLELVTQEFQHRDGRTYETAYRLVLVSLHPKSLGVSSIVSADLLDGHDAKEFGSMPVTVRKIEEKKKSGIIGKLIWDTYQ